MVFTKAKNASINVPTTRKGIDNNHTIGHKRSANMAIGQQKTNSIAQSIITNNIFIPYPRLTYSSALPRMRCLRAAGLSCLALYEAQSIK